MFVPRTHLPIFAKYGNTHIHGGRLFGVTIQCQSLKLTDLSDYMHEPDKYEQVGLHHLPKRISDKVNAIKRWHAQTL